MRKTVVKIVVCLISFFVSMFLVSMMVNKGNTDMTMEIAKATFPLIYMSQGDERINCLHGYANEMDGSTMREVITPIDENRQVSIHVEKFGNEIQSLHFEVRSVDGKRLVESTDITGYEETESAIEATFTIKDLIDKETEYNLILHAETGDGELIRYYSRIVLSSDYHVAEKMAFVKNFHESTFDKDRAQGIAMYLESNAEGDNSTYHHVNIHSSFQQITWGDLKVKLESDPTYSIYNIGRATAGIRLNYFVSIGGDTKYHVQEYYSLRYTPERIYLLNFERDMTEIFEPEGEVFGNDKIRLGIHSPEFSMKESDGGNVVAFVNEGRLFAYNIADNQFATLFTFYDGENWDERTLYDAHDIKILNVEETGNIQFLVYGYMNRGRHEGKVGIQIYYYNSMSNTIEEQAFLPENRTYDMVEADVKVLSYVNDGAHLYLMMAGRVYEVSLESKEYETIISTLKDNSYRVSSSNEMIAWKDTQDGGKLKLMNLSSQKQSEIQVGSGQEAYPLGFMGDDLIYGIANRSDIMTDLSGEVIIPMTEVKIQNKIDQIVKTYHQPGCYVTGAEILGNQIRLSRVQKEEETGQYVPMADEQIMSNESSQAGSNTVETVATQEYEKIVQIAVKSAIPRSGMKLLTPKEVIFEGGREVSISDRGNTESQYFVYGTRGIDSVYTEEKNAVDRGEEIAGLVTNRSGAYIWKAGNRSTKNQIMKIKGAAMTEERGSLAVCLDTILEYEGVDRQTAFLLEQKKTAVQILQENLEDAQILQLYGCSLDAVLYYVDQDIPVLAMKSDGSAVLIVGFNEMNTVLMDPVTGEVAKKGMNDSREMFSENGNRFITYIKK